MSTHPHSRVMTPMEPSIAPERFEFAGFRLEVRTHQLFKDSVRVPITTKAFDTLLALVRRHGRLVTKDELISEVWPDSIVSEDSLTQNISSLRRLLEDDPAQPRFIATVARRGYRFIAPVTEVLKSAAAPEPLAPLPANASPSPPPRTADASPPLPGIPSGWRIGWAAVGMLALLGGVTLGVLLTVSRTAEAPAERRLRFVPELPPDSTLASGGVVSPDGRHVAFIARERLSGETKLWIRNLSTGAASAVPGSDGALRPFWAPDSHAIAFFGGSRIRRAALTGGAPLVVCDTVQPRPTGGTWNEHGDILFGDSTGLFIVSADGGQPKPVREPSLADDEITLAWPQFLPGGRTFLYEVISTDEALTGIYAGSLDRPVKEKLLSVAGTQVAYTHGYLMYVQEGRLFARGFDSESLRFTADPVVVVDVTSPNAVVSAAADAVIAFGGGAAEELVEFDRQGQVIRTLPGTPPLRNLTLSPDQRTLIGEAIEPNRRGIWLIDLARQVPTRLIDNGSWPIWLPDGRTVAFAAGRESGPNSLYLRDMERGTDSLLLTTPGRPIVSHASADGRFIAYTMRASPETRQDIWVVSRNDPGESMRIISSAAREIHPEISPDGRWIAYASDEESPSFDVYVDAFPGLGHKKRVSTNGGTQPQWRGDGKELFYLSADQTLMAVDVTATRSLELGSARPLFRPMLLGLMSDFRNQYTVSADGKRFFVGVASLSSTREPITLLVNWRGSTD